jgi:hypothetical protein
VAEPPQGPELSGWPESPGRGQPRLQPCGALLLAFFCQATGFRLQETSRPDACCLMPSTLMRFAEDGFDVEDGGTVDRLEVVDRDPVSRYGLDPHGVQADGVGAIW